MLRRRDRSSPADDPAPYLGPRMKWALAVVVVGSTAAYLIHRWWENWVREGLGW